MSLFSKNAEAYKLDLNDVMNANVPVKYYMASGENGGVTFLLKSPNVTSELKFTRDQAKFLVEEFQFYIGVDDDN